MVFAGLAMAGMQKALGAVTRCADSVLLAQAIARSHRIGQTKEVRVLHLEAVADPEVPSQSGHPSENGQVIACHIFQQFWRRCCAQCVLPWPEST